MRLFAFLSVLLSFAAQAEVIKLNGTVQILKTFSATATVDSGLANGATWIKLDTADATGACPSIGSFGVLFYIEPNDKELLSVSLAAFMAGKSLEITVNDARRFHNGCVVEAVSVS